MPVHFDQDLFLLFAFLMSTLALVVLLKCCLGRRSPFRLTVDLVREHALSTRSLFYLLMVAGIIFLDILETRFDGSITRAIPWDCTHLMLRIEGGTGALFQLIHFPALTVFLSAVYLYVFPVMGVAAVLVAFDGKEGELARKIFWATIFNYVLILPFYILVPVAERWTVGGGDVALLMNSISPFLVESLRPMSGLNNCFPSFHTSLSVTYALLMTGSANRRAGRVMALVAGLIVYSTLYLGFHWTMDVFGGLLFASMCTLLATWAVARYPLELALFRAR